jgi:peptidoglycan/LPS O-acetylase OafA/YrhL
LGADWNLDFGNYPQFDTNSVPTGLHPAWTLGAEMTFYLLAPFLVRHWRIVAGLFVASLLLRGALVFHLGTRIVERWTYYFAPATFLFFLGGQGICLLSRHHAWLKDHRFGCGLMAGAFLIMLVTPDTGFDIRRLWISIACFTAGLPGFFDATKNIRWMNVLGNLSYPIYLVHPMAALLVAPPIYYEFVRLGLNSQPYLVPMLVTFLLASTLLGLLAHLVVEQPVAAVMKAVLTGPRRPRPRDAPV